MVVRQRWEKPTESNIYKEFQFSTSLDRFLRIFNKPKRVNYWFFFDSFENADILESELWIRMWSFNRSLEINCVVIIC